MRAAIIALSIGLLFAGKAEAAPWQYQSKIDKFTDEKTSFAWSRQARGALYVRCQAGMLEAYLVGFSYLGDDGSDVRWRVDKGAVEEESWSVATQGDSVFAPYPSLLARALVSGASAVFEVTDFRGAPHEMTFPLTGSGSAVSRVMDDCAITASAYRKGDTEIWERVVTDLDEMPVDGFRNIQQALNLLAPSELPKVSGKRDAQTYRVATNLYAAYWSLCEKGTSLGASCDEYKALFDRDKSASYPAEVTGIVFELVKKVLDEQKEPSS